jgi:hypothetical protein
MRPILLPLLSILAVVATAPEAAAQLGSRPAGGYASGAGGSLLQPNAPGAGVRPPPPALPGLANRRAPDPIPADPSLNLAPTAALFDAVMRGDLPAAREAVGRGADTVARNVLGLTPLDAAVDQGRTEIMFYLLSVRAGTRVTTAPETALLPPGRRERPGRGGPTREATQREPTPREVAARERQERQAAERAERTAQRNANRASPAAASAEAPRAPRVWAGDGGAARPEAGFLGFDAGRPAGGAPPPAEAPAAPRGNRG